MAKYFTIIIGSYGLYVKLNDGRKLLENIFLKELSEESIKEILPIFKKYSKAKITILLDNIGQNYTIKKFPLNIGMFNILKVVNRRFNFEISKNDLRAKIFVGKSDDKKDLEYLFASSPVDNLLYDVIEFIEAIPNFLVGIYMIPLESQNLLKVLTKKLNIDNGKTKWILLLLENKVSGIRQIAFKNNKLVFTRFLYNIDENMDGKSKILLYENDITRTIGFIKRFLNNFKIEDLYIISITTNPIKNIFSKAQLSNIKSYYFTPSEISSLIFNKKNNTAIDDEFCDFLLQNFIMNGKKVLKFSTKSIKNAVFALNINRYLKILSCISSCLLIYALCFCIYVFFLYFVNMQTLKTNLKQQENELSEKKNSEILKDKNIDNIIEIGMLYDYIKDNSVSPFKYFNFFKKTLVNENKIEKFYWKLDNFDAENFRKKVLQVDYNIKVNLKNNDATGASDSMILTFNNYKTEKEAELSKSFIINKFDIDKNKIDFNKKYFNYPVEINLEKKE